MCTTQSTTQGTTSGGLAYISVGPSTSRSALLCVPGWSCRADDFSYLFEVWHIPGEHALRAIALDLPGYGRTPSKICPEPSIAAKAKLVVELCNELQIENAVLLGHSMGCRVVLDAWDQCRKARASDRPGVRIKGLVFLDGSHFKLRKQLYSFDSTLKEANAPLSAEEKLNAKLEAFSGMFSKHTPQKFQQSTLDHLRRLDPAYDEKLRRSHVDYDFDRMDDAIENLGRSDTSFLNIQSSDVDGRNRRVPLGDGETTKWTDYLRAHVAQGKQVVIADTLHFPHVDRPEAIAQALNTFLMETLALGDTL